ncbi:MAG: bifunctional metallophosphatase/5'-nucleotidase [Ruminococcus sp.]|nr:bifunctional metallophosphatase/5'-nucleotidase [Ruminococcus sp.]
MKINLNSFLKSLMAVLMSLLLIMSVCFGAGAIAESTADSAQLDYDGEFVTVLFTHDLHSNFLPVPNEDGGEDGGYARLMTVINKQREKYPDAILVDGGDFSMGSLFQTCFKTDALELRLMGKMGYDVTTLGNHEFDYLPEGLASMLRNAVDSGDKLPQIVDANYLPPEKGQEGYNEEIVNAFDYYGVKKYTIIERGGVYFVVFGITGLDSNDCAPNSGMILEDAAEVSQQVVDEARAECKALYGKEPVVVCLSHSGTSDGKGEDYDLANKVDGIDLIVSAHTHTTLQNAIEVNGTAIVSAGNYGKYLGVAHLSVDSDTPELVGYELIPVDENVEEDMEISQLVQEYKDKVNETYLAPYGFTYDEVILSNSYKFHTVKEVKDKQHESTLGNLFSDAYKAAAEKALSENVDVALTATGVIRGTIPAGEVTVSDVFNAASLGVGTEGELIRVYLTGRDLKNVFEVDASVQPLMKNAQLFVSGARYSFNTNRMIFNKIMESCLVDNEGNVIEIEDDKLYSVVTGMYAGQMLGSVKEKSFGLLTVVARDEEGNPIEIKDFGNYVIRDEKGNTVKEWYAIASYLDEMINDEMDKRYAETDGRKLVYSSVSPSMMLRNANVFTYVALALILILLFVLVLVIVLITRKIKKKKSSKTK